MGLFKVIKQHEQLPIEISPDYKRMDIKNTPLMRAGWDPALMDVAEGFFAMRMGERRKLDKPGHTDIDVALARGGWCLEDEAGGPMSGGGIGNQKFYTWEDEVYHRKTHFDSPSQASSVVKQAVKFLGADLVGIADYDERWVYSHIYHPLKKEYKPMSFPFEPSSVIVMGIEMNYDNYRLSPSFLSSAATGYAYGQMAVTSLRVAKFLRAMGYQAIPCGNDTALSVPLALQAGLGEMSRIGVVVTPEFGPRVRFCKVFTDLPLKADRPITFGVVDFCKTCMKCADACPVQAISREPEPSFETAGYSNNPGVKKWTSNLESCIKYWSANVDCANCIASCPYNKPDNWVHRVGLRVAQTPAKRLLRWLDDVLGYGKTSQIKNIESWWHDRPEFPRGTQEGETELKPTEIGGLMEITDSTTPKDVFYTISEKLKQNPGNIAGLNAVFQFHLSGEGAGDYYLDIQDGTVMVGEGARTDAACTYSLAAEDFLSLIAGKLNAPKAILMGKIAVCGDMSLALRLRQFVR